MRPLLLLGAGALVLLGLGACDQDYAASNADRHSFMGQIHAAPLPSETASAQPLPPPALPTTTAAAPSAAPSASPSASASGSASAAPAPSASPAPARPRKH